MDSIRWISEKKPALRNPILIVAFEGWNDAGEAATEAAKHIQERLAGEKFADLNPETFYDFTETRPTVMLNEQGREIEWPKNEFTGIQLPDEDADLIILLGTEPQLKWRTFAEQLMAIIDEFDVRLVISLGSLIAEVAHSRPATIYTTSNDPDLIDELNLEPSNYEGPTGIIGILQDQLRVADINSLSLWATIPGYAPYIPSPKATLALIQKISQLISYNIPTSLLELNTTTYENQIAELLEQDEETREYVKRIEEDYDNSMRPESGAALIEELEQFLRDREE